MLTRRTGSRTKDTVLIEKHTIQGWKCYNAKLAMWMMLDQHACQKLWTLCLIASQEGIYLLLETIRVHIAWVKNFLHPPSLLLINHQPSHLLTSCWLWSCASSWLRLSSIWSNFSSRLWLATTTSLTWNGARERQPQQIKPMPPSKPARKGELCATAATAVHLKLTFPVLLS